MEIFSLRNRCGWLFPLARQQIKCRYALAQRAFCSPAPEHSNIEQEIQKAGGRVRVAIVGAGPAGFYTAQSLMKDFRDLHQVFHNKSLGLQIDILDRNPVGNGLVRSGVAPDHPEVKHVQHRFQEILEENGEDPFLMQFFGNVNVARSDRPQQALLLHDQIHVSLPALRNCYHATVFVSSSHDDQYSLRALWY